MKAKEMQAMALSGFFSENNMPKIAKVFKDLSFDGERGRAILRLGAMERNALKLDRKEYALACREAKKLI